MKKIDIRIIIIIVLLIVLGIMLYFYFKDDSVNFSYNNRNKNTSNETSEVILSSTSQVTSALDESIRLHAGYYYKKILVSENAYIKKGTKIIEYTNGKYLTAPYDLVLTGYNLPLSKELCTLEHNIEVSSFNVLKVSFRVDESKINSLSLGQTATIKFPALESKEITGYITKISNTASNGKFTVEVEFDNDGDIRIGMTANITI